MFIHIEKLRPRQFAWNYRKDQRILLIGLYFWAVGLDFGLKRSAWYKHFNKGCEFCGDHLMIRSRQQVMRWHGFCRERGRRSQWKELKEAKRAAVSYTRRYLNGDVGLQRFFKKPGIPSMVRP